MNTAAYCKAKLKTGNILGAYPCRRPATKDGYCFIHYPSAVAKRKAKAKARYEAKSANREVANKQADEDERRINAYPLLVAALRVTQEHINARQDDTGLDIIRQSNEKLLRSLVELI